MAPHTVLTGAAGALGGAVAGALAGRGHRVTLIDLASSHERAQALASEIGGSALSLSLDPSSADPWGPLVEQAEAAFGPVTGAVLVAGGWRGGAPFHEGGAADLEPMLQANLRTAEQALRALLPGLVQRRQGSVVVVGSRAVERPWASAGAASYAASKAALVALMQAIAAEVLEHGVRLNAVLPSTIDTPANRRAMPDADPARWVSASSLASVIAFLLSDDARDISGASVPVYGRALKSDVSLRG